MRVPLEWLHEYCHPALSTAALAERLTMTGTKVEAIHRHGVPSSDRFVVGRVLEADKHPDADRLSVCIVDIGQGDPSQIVCGAPNVAAGQTVAVAQPGAVLPDGRTLTAAKLRGVQSNGMILAEDELDIGTEHDGILVIDEDALEPGTPLDEVLPIATEVLELEITSNRPDCLAIYGVAREAHAATGAPLAPPPWAEDPGREGPIDALTIEVQCPEQCHRFTARVFEEVQIGPSPPWLKARLMAAGQRPITNVVDITNYVMLLTGQPLHAFDLDRVAGGTLTVRLAHRGEPVETLDGVVRVLDEQMVLIADAEGPTSVAGVMGGARSEVGGQTTRVVMEAATWSGPSIHRTAWTLGLQSEASVRFEKQLQPEQAMEAQAVAARLMVEVCGARPVPGTIDIGGPGPPPSPIRLRDERVASLLGETIPRGRAREILESLEFATQDAPDGLDVRTPAFRRGDVTREVDLIEEVARLDGLDKVPSTVPATSRSALAVPAPGRLTARQALRRTAADALAAQGLNEAVGWTFGAPDTARRLRLPPELPELKLENPMSAEHSRLRTTLVASLLDIVARNLSHGAGRVRIFEAGAVFLPRDDRELPDEPYHVGALITGPVRPPSWREPQPPRADFFSAKGVLEGLLDALDASVSLERSTESFLHPGKRAAISIDGRGVGWLGEIHPVVAAEWDIEQAVAGFELDLDALPEPPTVSYRELPTFPDVREDLAVVVSEDVSAEQVLDVVRRSGGELLAGVELFDVYRDPERLGERNTSLALRLTFRASDRTLTDEEVAAQRERIVAALSDELSGRIRAS